MIEKVRQNSNKASKTVDMKFRIDWWNNEHKFNSPDDIPEIPLPNNEQERNFIINRLIEFGALPKSKLIEGETYIGSCRNSDTAVWDGKKFHYQRTKFGYTYDEPINHFEDDDGYDVFIPIRKIII